MTDEDPPRYPSARERLRGGTSPPPDLEVDDETDDEAFEEFEEADTISFEGLLTALSDPFYDYLLALALSLGLTPLDAPDARYAITWTFLLAVGAGAYLLGRRDRPEDSVPGNLAGGIGFGVLIGLPVLVLLAPALALTSEQLFSEMSDAAVYMAVLFAMPVGETLFFRGMMQETHGFRAAALTAGIWSFLLFAPSFSAAAGAVVGIGVFALSFAYAYVRQRNGLAAAWLCQSVANVLLFFLPRLG